MVHKSLQPAGSKKTLDELVTACLSMGYENTFKQPPQPKHRKMKTAESILYHMIEMDSLVASEEVNL